VCEKSIEGEGWREREREMQSDTEWGRGGEIERGKRCTRGEREAE